MDWILSAVVGWCGTGWPIHFRGGGGGGLEPGDWGPPGCWVCGRILGAIGGLVAHWAFSGLTADAGLGVSMAVAFFGGGFLAEVVGGLRTGFGLGK